MRPTFMIVLYRYIMALGAPFLNLWLRRHNHNRREDITRISERLGKNYASVSSMPVIWLHAASIGETIMIRPLIERLAKHYPQAQIVLTTVTVTAARMIGTHLPENTRHQYIPIDTPQAVRRFLNHWKPVIGIWAESEIWPNLLIQARMRNMRTVLINARLSQKSLQNWRRFQHSARYLFDCFDLIFAADTDTAQNLKALTNQNIMSYGNLKFSAPPLNVNENTLEQFRQSLHDRITWCATSTHPQEHEALLKTHQRILQTHPNALLLLAPRHPDQITRLKKHLQKYAIATNYRSSHTPLTNAHKIFLFDTIGELGLVYRLTRISFIGGSLHPQLSGHNPIEPALLGNVLLSGPHMNNFKDIYNLFLNQNAAIQIQNADQLSTQLLELFANPQRSRRLSEKSLNLATEKHAVIDNIWADLFPFIEQAGL